MANEKNNVQIIWGGLLVIAGIGVIIKFHSVIPQIKQISSTYASMIPFIGVCFYLMGIILIGGGVKKIFNHLVSRKQNPQA